jgi:hypothetical protein
MLEAVLVHQRDGLPYSLSFETRRSGPETHVYRDFSTQIALVCDIVGHDRSDAHELAFRLRFAVRRHYVPNSH